MDDNKAATIMICSFLTGLTIILTSAIFWLYYNENCFIQNWYSQEYSPNGLIWVKK